MKFTLHFVGINIIKKSPSLRYYADFLQMRMEDNSDRTIIVPETTGMRVEIFAPRGQSKVFDHPVASQTVRPCIHVRDLSKITAWLEKRGAMLGEGLEKTARGQRIELIAPDGVRWLVAQGRSYVEGGGFRRPHVGSADLMVRSLKAQLRFYTDLLGMRISGEHEGQTMLRDRTSGIFLLVAKERPSQTVSQHSLPVQPAFLSFQTADVAEAEQMLRSRGVTVVQPTTTHYFGTDLLILDAEENVVQVVEYK
ncbi:MAG TPA: VOC family protein [Candidatus Saccharimonadales bacterium]|jgi:predicted enzyme related to lactoylglutathione lyase|nr:VOC family protein [Candidatus Saccharimonadales bacterium]